MQRLMVAALVVLGGCVSVEDIRSYEPADQHSVPEQFDELAGCLTQHYQAELSGAQITPVISPRQRRATILLATPGYMTLIPFGEITIIGDAPAASRVYLRRRKTVFNQQADVERFRSAIAACVPGWMPPS